MLKGKKGISLTTVVITVFILIIIMSTLVYSAVDSIKIRKLNKMYNDLRQLDDAVGVYYLKNGELPIKNEAKEIVANTVLGDNKLKFAIKGKSQVANASGFFNPNDFDASLGKAIYYEVDVKLLDNITLNYPTNTFIVNVNSHAIYNYTGVSIDGKTYNTLPIEYKDIQYKENNAVTEINLKNISDATNGINTIYVAYSSETVNLRDYLLFDSVNGQGLGEPKEVEFSYISSGPSTNYYNLDTQTGKLTRNASALVNDIDATYSNPEVLITASNYDSSKPAVTKTIQLQYSSVNAYTTDVSPSLVDHINLATAQSENTYKEMKNETTDGIYVLRRNGVAIYPSENPNVKVTSSDSEIATGSYTKPNSGGDFGKINFSSLNGTKAGSADITFQIDGFGNAIDVIPVYVYDFKICEELDSNNNNIQKIDFSGTGEFQAKTVRLNVTAPDGIYLNYTGANKNIDVTWSEASYNSQTREITKLQVPSGVIETIEVSDIINAKITPKTIGSTYLLCEFAIENEPLGKCLIPINVYGSISATGLTSADSISLTESTNSVTLTYSLDASVKPVGSTISYTFTTSNNAINLAEGVSVTNNTGIFEVRCANDATANEVKITAEVTKEDGTKNTYEDTVKIAYSST